MSRPKARVQLSQETIDELNQLLVLVEEAAEQAASARHHRRVVLDIGYLYVVRFDSGVIKVGKTSSPTGRLKSHALSGFVVESWVSDEHQGHKVTEAALIAFCNQRGQLHGGREYFTGITFELARDYAELLVMETEIRKAQTVAADRRAYLDKLVAASGGDDSMTWQEAHLLAFGADVPIPGWAPKPSEVSA